MADEKSTYLRVRLHPGQDDRLIAWIQSLDDQSYGVKSQTIREALLRGIGASPDPAAQTIPSSAPDLDEFLPQMRRVVETAVGDALARNGVRLTPGPQNDPVDESEEVAAILDAMGNLFLEDDDDEF